MDYQDAVEYLGAAVEPSDGEKRNGWDTVGLTIYVAECKMREADMILNKKPPRPDATQTRMRWLIR